jgi:phospholipase C
MKELQMLMLTNNSGGNRFKSRLMSCAAACVFAGSAVAPMSAAASDDTATQTPIKHVIIIIGENRIATYTPANKKDTVLNLLSQKIIKADGTPGSDYNDARQSSAKDGLIYELSPGHRAPYKVLPPALSGGPSTPYGCQVLGITTGTSCVSDANIAQIKKFENGLDDGYYKFMLTGGTGQKSRVPDARILYDGKDASGLPPGPFQLSNSETFPYDAYAASPVHRFYQMWQQLDCDANAANSSNGWGCRADLFPWVEVTQGAGSNGAAQPAGFNNESTGEGSTAMGFYNVQQGDAPYLEKLADTYTMSDNYHQAVNGGTGANHVMLIGTGDAIWFSDGKGNAQVPPNNPVNPANPGTPVPGYSSALSEIENPNPQPGPTISTFRTAMAAAQDRLRQRRPRRTTAAARTAIVPTWVSPALPRWSAICRRCPARSSRAAKAVSTISSITTIRDISATAAMPTPTLIRIITCTRSRLRACVTSAMC